MITDEEIEAPIKPIPELSFTVLDFMLFFRKAYPAEWATLVELYGLFDSRAPGAFGSQWIAVYRKKSNPRKTE